MTKEENEVSGGVAPLAKPNDLEAAVAPETESSAPEVSASTALESAASGPASTTATATLTATVTVPSRLAGNTANSDGNLVEATPVKDIEPVAAVEATVVREGANKTPKNKVLVVVAAVAALVVVVLVVALSLRGSKSQAEGEATAVVPPVDPERLESIRSVLAPISGEAVFDPDSEEFSVDRIEALDWLVEEDRKSPFPLDDATQLWHIRQLYVLAVFYFATGGDHWQHQYKFLQGTNECDWNAEESQRECIKDIEVCDCENGEECLVSNDNDPRGIVCNDQGRVTNIATYWNGLTGTIPEELSYLNETLVEINIGGGSLTGTIPSSIQQLSLLENFAVHDNCLSGTIPDLSGLPSLAILLLYNNKELSGSLNGFCDGPAFKNPKTVALSSDCGCPGGAQALVPAPPPIECECCLCCDMSRFECCDAAGNSWSSIAFGEFNTDGFLESFEKPCLSEASKEYVEDECPCFYDSKPDESLFFGKCTSNCSRADAIPSYSW